jgi:hypothetical protein
VGTVIDCHTKSRHLLGDGDHYKTPIIEKTIEMAPAAISGRPGQFSLRSRQ